MTSNMMTSLRHNGALVGEAVKRQVSWLQAVARPRTNVS